MENAYTRKKWQIWCSKAGVSGPASNFINHLLLNPWISGPACFSHGYILCHLEQSQNQQHGCSLLMISAIVLPPCLVRLCSHLSEGGRTPFKHSYPEQRNQHLRRTDLWKKQQKIKGERHVLKNIGSSYFFAFLVLRWKVFKMISTWLRCPW